MRHAHVLPVPLSLALLLLVGSAGLVGCGGGASDGAPAVAPTSAPATDAKAAKPAANDEGNKAAAIAQLTTGEAKSGTCDPAHQQALEKVLAEVEAGMSAKTGEDGKPLGFQVVGKRIVALGPTAKGVELTVSGKGTDLHVLAYGVNEISMDVLAGNAAATTLRSPFQRSSTSSPVAIDLPKIGKVTEVQSDSRQVVIKPGQPLAVKMTGQGCAGLISFLKP